MTGQGGILCSLQQIVWAALSHSTLCFPVAIYTNSRIDFIYFCFF